MTHRNTHDSIAEIAYRAWVDRGQPYGTPEVDWYYALSVISDPETIRVTSPDRLASEDGDLNANISTTESAQAGQPANDSRAARNTKEDASISSRSSGNRRRGGKLS